MKNLTKNLSLRRRIVVRLALAVVLFSTVIALITTALQLYNEYQRDLAEINDRMEQIKSSYVDSLTKSVWVVDGEQIQTQLRGILQLPDISYLNVKVDGQVKWSAGSPHTGRSISLSLPLIREYEGTDLKVGDFFIEADLDHVFTQLRSNGLVILLSNGAETFLIVGFIFFIFQVLVTRHLGRIAKYVQGLDFGRPAAPLMLDRAQRDDRGPDELDEVVDAINHMRGNLKSSYAALQESESRFGAFTDNTPAKIHIKDLEGRYIFINLRSEELFGVTNAEAQGKRAEDIFPDKKGEEFSGHDREVLASGRVITREETFDGKDGKITFLTVKFPIRDSEGKIVAVGAVGTDITERKQVDEAIRAAHDQLEARVDERTAELTQEITERMNTVLALQESEQRFKDIAETASDWFWEMGPDLTLTYISDRYIKLTGRRPEDILGKRRWGNLEKGVLESEPEKWAEHRRQLENHEPFRDFDYPVQGKDERWFTIRLNGMPVFDKDGTFKGYRGTGTDITERRQAEQALRAAKEEAEQANIAKSHFLANMSHELRTPLNAIIGFTDTIQQKIFGPMENDKYAEYIDNIHESGHHLLELINDILDVSAIEAERMELHEENFELSDVIESAMKLVRTRAVEGRVRLVDDIDDPLPHMHADERRVKQILLNLLTNAVKFTHEGGEVRIKAETDGDGDMIIRVIDTGIGMSPDEIPKALKPFRQIDSTLSRQHEGTGLGLHLSRRMAEMHGGSLEIKSEKGIGTEVIVRFPAERVLAG